MMRNVFFSIVAVFCCFAILMTSVPELLAAQFFFKPRSSGNQPSGEVGFRIPFGEGCEKKEETVIEKLKNEETEGLTGFGLIVLGACIVVATLLIIGKADDIKDDVLDKADELTSSAEDKIDEITDDLRDKYEDTFTSPIR